MKVQNYFSVNLKKLAERYSQKKIAEDTRVSPASINNYINKDSEPSIYFLMQLKSAYGINVDDFLFKPLEKAGKSSDLPVDYERFLGNYMLYHYDTSPSKGEASTYANNTLNYGVTTLYLNGDEIKSKTLFMSNRKEAEEILETLNTQEKLNNVLEFYDAHEKYKYEGDFSYSNSQLFLSLSNAEKNDKSLLIFNNPPSIKDYLGGIGTVNTVSRGREHMPCVQYILMTRDILSISDGEIYNLLALDLPDVNLSVETDELIKLFKTLYGDNEVATTLAEDHKKNIIENTLSNLLSESIEANAFRFAKVSSNDDDKYYRMIKRNRDV